MMTLTELIYFNEVAKTGSFTVAAVNLYISQPSLSYSIQQLEKKLDAPLFVRHKNKRVELTPCGAALLPYAEMAITDVQKGADAVKELTDPLSSTVRIEFFWSLSTILVPALFTRYKAEHPDVSINFEFIVNHGWTELNQSLTNGKADLVISAGNLSGECSSSCIAYQRIMAYVPISHPLAQKDTVTFEDLKDEHILALILGCNLDWQIKQIYRKHKIEPNFTYTTDWCAQILQVSVNGKIGINIDHTVTTPLVKKIPIDDEDSFLKIYVSWPNNKKLSSSAEFIRDYLIGLADRIPAEERIF